MLNPGFSTRARLGALLCCFVLVIMSIPAVHQPGVQDEVSSPGFGLETGTVPQDKLPDERTRATGLSVLYVGNTVVDLQWDSYEGNFSRYDIYRNETLVESVDNQSTDYFRIEGLDKGQDYNFTLEVYNSSGDKVEESSVWATAGQVEGILSNSTHWAASSGPYRLTDGLMVGEGVTFTMEPGVVIDISQGAMIIESELASLSEVTVIGGELVVGGVSGFSIENCSFTGSSRSRELGLSLLYCEDVLIDSCEFTGFWTGLWVKDSQDIRVSRSSFLESDRGIHLEDSSDYSLWGNRFSGNQLGLELETATGKGRITGNQICENGGGILCSENSDPLIRQNGLVDNRDYDVNNTDSGIIIDAVNNWWGSPEGTEAVILGKVDSADKLAEEPQIGSHDISITIDQIDPADIIPGQNLDIYGNFSVEPAMQVVSVSLHLDNYLAPILIVQSGAFSAQMTIPKDLADGWHNITLNVTLASEEWRTLSWSFHHDAPVVEDDDDNQQTVGIICFGLVMVTLVVVGLLVFFAPGEPVKRPRKPEEPKNEKEPAPKEEEKSGNKETLAEALVEEKTEESKETPVEETRVSPAGE